jgi:hypothetical protein
MLNTKKMHFGHFPATLEQKSHFDKKTCENAKTFCGRFFCRKQTKSVNLWLGGPLIPRVSPKCFLSQTDKNSIHNLK